MDDKNAMIAINEISLMDMLEPDNAVILGLESLEDKEEEYSQYLGTFEYTIAYYYYERDKKITDREIIKLLTDIKYNLDKKLNYFTHPLGSELIANLVEVIEDEPITVHEFKLAIDYALTSIDNRSWMSDRQAYLKWICYYFDINISADDAMYVKKIKRLGKRYDISLEMIESLLAKAKDLEDEDEDEYLDPEQVARIEDFLALDDDERFDYLVENSPENLDIFMSYLFELEEKGEFEIMQKLAKRFSKKFGEMFALHLKLGDFFFVSHPNIARGYYDKALSALEKVDLIPDDLKLEISEEIKNNIRVCNKINS